MAVDHLLGTDPDPGESGLADPVTFAVAIALCAGAAALLFGWVLPRSRREGSVRATVIGFVASLVSVVPGIAFVWLGFPLVVAGAGVELGLEGRRGARGRLAVAAVVIGAALIAFAGAYYVVATLRRLA